MFQARSSEGDNMPLKTKCVDARINVRDAVLLAKGRWVREVADRVHKMNFSLRKLGKQLKRCATVASLIMLIISLSSSEWLTVF